MVTIKDVAKKSGFSITTVSRALNGYSDVNEQSRKLIIDVAEQLNYVPNKTAQKLVKKDNKTIALIVSGLLRDGGKDNMVYMLLSGMYNFTEEIGYEVALFTMSSAYQQKKSYMKFCREHSIKGAIIAGIRTDDKYFQEIMTSELPCVLIDIDLDGKNVSSINIDDKKAAKELVQYLIDNNHKNIGMVNGRKEAYVSTKRLNGYKEALENNGIEFKEEYVVTGDYIENKAYDVTKQLVKNYKEITALFCASDIMAVGSMRAIKDCNRKIPQDISIVGFDDIPLAAYTTPPLTTISQNFYDKGIEAAKQLIKMMNKNNYDKKIILDYKFIERESVKENNT